VTDTLRMTPINLLEVTTRAVRAGRIIESLSLAMPALADLWRQVDGALSDVQVLAAEISQLRDSLTASWIDRANLAAAGRATISAYRGGEDDPLSYLRDELLAQGFGTERSGA
jgi:hypothetical protein